MPTDTRICYKRSSNFVTRKIAGEIVLVPLHQNTGEMRSIYSLNETGSVLWEAFDGNTSLQSILKKIESEYEVDSGLLEKDLDLLLSDLLEIQAILPV